KEQYTGLVRKRGSVKQRLTLFQKYLSDLIGVSSHENYEIEEESVYELEQRLSSAIFVLSEYEDFQIQIELLVSDFEIDIQYQDRAEFQSNYYTWTSKGQKLLKTFQAKFQIDDRNSVHSGNSRLNESIDRIGQQTDKWDTLIIHMVGLKLDNSTNRKWEEHQVGSDPPTLLQFQNFLNTRADFLESLELKIGSRQPKGQNQSRCLVGSKESDNNGSKVCLSEEDKYGKAKELKLCLNCLKGGHFVQKCRQKSLCNKCNRKHNSLLHYEVGQVEEHLEDVDSSQVALSSFAPSSAMVHLSTVSLQVFDKFGKPHTVKAILDSGSQSSYISSNLANLLQLKRTHLDFKVVGLNLATTKIEGRCQVKVQPHHTGFNTIISCLVIPEITGKLPEFSFDISGLAIPKHIRLADPSFNKCSKINMLLGADCFWDLLCAAQIKLGVNKPVLQKQSLDG
ncbi:hypothetical protein NQ318_008136, partial [Aromia moschata]